MTGIEAAVFGAILAHSAQVAQLNEGRLWTFIGNLKPANGCAAVLGGCFPNGTAHFTIASLSWQECHRYVARAEAEDIGGSGGACI